MKIQCDKMNTEFHLQYENDQIKKFLYSNGDFLIKSGNELPIVGKIARTTTNSARTYPSRYRDGELIVIREFSFLEMSRVYLRRFISNYVQHHLKAL